MIVSWEGPSALENLTTVTLGIRKHRVAFTKNIWKLYQCAEDDATVQHVRRILWRLGETNKEPKVFVTNKVSYGDRPAVYIAIAAIRETAERLGLGSEEAAWFLKHRTYMDEATSEPLTRLWHLRYPGTWKRL
jgi:hypothetical protein